MNQKQRIFAAEYLVDPTRPGDAAVRAGYAKTAGARLLHNPEVAALIASGIKRRALRTGFDADWVLVRAAALADFNIKKFITVDKTGRLFYDFTQATDLDWYCISEVTVRTIGQGVNRIPVEEVKFKSVDKLRALEMVGKHVTVQAFKDNVEHSGRIEVTAIERVIVSPPAIENA